MKMTVKNQKAHEKLRKELEAAREELSIFVRGVLSPCICTSTPKCFLVLVFSVFWFILGQEGTRWDGAGKKSHKRPDTRVDRANDCSEINVRYTPCNLDICNVLHSAFKNTEKTNKQTNCSASIANKVFVAYPTRHGRFQQTPTHFIAISRLRAGGGSWTVKAQYKFQFQSFKHLWCRLQRLRRRRWT